MSALGCKDYFDSHPKGSDDLDGTTTPTSLDLGCPASHIPSTLPDVPEELPEYGTMDNDEGHLRRAFTNMTDRSSRAGHYNSRRPTMNSSDISQRPPLPVRQQQQTEYPQRGYTEADYYAQNPWYGTMYEQPVFSLGKPLPHVVRRRGKTRTNTNPKGDEEQGLSYNTIAEFQDPNNEGDIDNHLSGVPTRARARQSGRAQTQLSDFPSLDTQRRHNATTEAGAAHGPKRNEAGQPVFEYIPGEAQRTEGEMARRSTQRSSDPQRPTNRPSYQPAFKIDGEPLVQAEKPAVEEGLVDPDQMRNWWARVRARHPGPLAEFLATTVAIFLSLAGTLSVNLSARNSTAYGDYETSCWAAGFAWMFGIYLGGGVSGAHMNPAISVSLSIFRGFPWKQCAVYVGAQFLASLAAGGLAYGCFADAIHSIDPEMADTSRSFFSTPQEWISVTSAFFNQVVGGAVMIIAVFSLGDDQNNPPGAGMHAFVLGLLVTTLKFTLGYNVGSALNPACDFGPRIIAYAIGYHEENVFKSHWWLFGPWLGTLVGSLLGCVVYDGCIFVGSESPINYRSTGSLKEKTRRFWSPFAGKGKETDDEFAK